jgi:hypothetical protein
MLFLAYSKGNLQKILLLPYLIESLSLSFFFEKKSLRSMCCPKQQWLCIDQTLHTSTCMGRQSNLSWWAWWAHFATQQ